MAKFTKTFVVPILLTSLFVTLALARTIPTTTTKTTAEQPLTDQKNPLLGLGGYGGIGGGATIGGLPLIKRLGGYAGAAGGAGLSLGGGNGIGGLGGSGLGGGIVP